ncbi:MAG: hypothetical protein K2G96_02730, partial [Clostridia bacterium]|nr:hypothetical protein [Clostridia bacterium]
IDIDRRTQKRVRRFEFAICKLKCYNFSKGKRLKFAWLRSGNADYAYYARYLSGSGSSNSAFPSRLLAVRPALYFYPAKGLQT